MTQSNNNNTGSFAGTNKSISSTKINKQNFYLSTLNMNSTVVENSNSITKTIQNIPTTLENPTNSTNCTITTISTNNEKPFTLSSSSTTTTTKPNSDTNLSPISPSSTVSPQTNRKSTQISSLLNSLNNASNPIIDTSSSEISNCKSYIYFYFDLIIFFGINPKIILICIFLLHNKKKIIYAFLIVFMCIYANINNFAHSHYFFNICFFFKNVNVCIINICL